MLEPRGRSNETYLEDVNTLPTDHTQEFVVFIEMPACHLCRLIHCMLNLDGYTTTGLGLFDNLLQS